MSANTVSVVVNEVETGKPWWEGQTMAVTGSQIAQAARLRLGMTAEEIRQAAGLDWDAIKTPLWRYRDGQYDSTNAWQVYRSDTGAQLHLAEFPDTEPNVVSPREMVDFALRIAEEYNGVLVSAGWLSSAKAWCQIKLDSTKINGEMIDSRMLFHLDFAALQFGVRAATVNVVCENTLMANLGNGRRHLFFDSLEDSQLRKLTGAVKIAAKKHDDKIARYQRLAQMPCDPDGRELLAYAVVVSDLSLLDQVVAATDPESVKPLIAEYLDQRKAYTTYDALGKLGKDTLAAIINGDGADLDARKNNWYGASQAALFAVNRLGRSADTSAESIFFGQRADLADNVIIAAERIASATV